MSFDGPGDSRRGAGTSRLAAYVRAAEFANDRKKVVLTLRQPVTADGFVLGSRVVFDLRADPKQPETSAVAAAPAVAEDPPAAAAPPSLPTVEIRGGEHPGFSRLVFEWPGPVGYEVERDGDHAPVRFDQSGSPHLYAVPSGKSAGRRWGNGWVR